MQWRHHKFSKRKTFYGTKNDSSKAGGSDLAPNQDLLKEQDYNRKLKSFTNISKLGDIVSKSVQLRWGQWTEPPPAGRLWGSGGKAPSRWAIFCKFLEKNSYFNAIWITFRTFSEPFEIIKLLRYESQLNKSFLLLQVKSKTCLRCCILGFKILYLCLVRGIKVHCYLQHFWH